MDYTNRRLFLSHYTVSSFRVIIILLVFVCMQSAVYAGSDEKYSFHSGIQNSKVRPLTKKQIQSLLEGLHVWSGFTEMSFDEDGFLKLGDRAQITGGSATARALLIAAIDGKDSFALENHDRSSAISFAQIEPVIDYIKSDGTKHVVWELRLDFHDFTHLRGESKVITAFNPAANMMHELVHGVLNLRDPLDSTDQLGDCERHINLMRDELGLPLRKTYQPQKRFALTIESTAQTLLAELTFIQTDADTCKKKDFILSFNAERVSMANKNISDFIAKRN